MKKVIAVDFDGTLFEDAWPDIGKPNWSVIRRAKAEQAAGAKLILWTCREGEKLTAALKACVDVGLQFDVVNENLKDLIDEWNTDPRKIGATEYWDDKAQNPCMTLGQFVTQCVAHNTLTRVWLPVKEPRSNGHRLLWHGMEWELLRHSPALCNLKFKCVTDIRCDEYTEAVNLVVEADN